MIVLIASFLSAASPTPPPLSYQRAIEVLAPGKAQVVLDASVYERARADLGDLRVEDDHSALVPFVLVRGFDETSRTIPARILNRSFVRKKSLTVTLDFGERLLKRSLHVSTEGDSFRRRVAVEGSDDGSSWKTLVDGAYVFAIPGVDGARFETVTLPENDYPQLRVTMENDRDDPPVLTLREASVESGRKPRERLLPTTLRIEHDAVRKKTQLYVDLGAAGQPFFAIDLDVLTPRFFRTATVDALGGTGDGNDVWRAMVDSGIYRYDDGPRWRESVRLQATGVGRRLRVRIRDGDDAPLDIRGVQVLAPEDVVAFEAAAEKRYFLSYGFPDRAKPTFDLERTIGDPAAWASTAATAMLGPETFRDETGRRPWSERHPALLWTGLVAAVAALGFLTYRALRRANS